MVRFFLSVIIATDNTFFYVKILLSSSITGNWLYLIIYTDTKRHYVSFSRRTASRLVSSKRACKYKYTPNTRSTNHSETLLMRKLLERHFPLLDTSYRHQDGRVVFFFVPKSVMEHGIVLSCFFCWRYSRRQMFCIMLMTTTDWLAVRVSFVVEVTGDTFWWLALCVVIKVKYKEQVLSNLELIIYFPLFSRVQFAARRSQPLAESSQDNWSPLFRRIHLWPKYLCPIAIKHCCASFPKWHTATGSEFFWCWTDISTHLRKLTE